MILSSSSLKEAWFSVSCLLWTVFPECLAGKETISGVVDFLQDDLDEGEKRGSISLVWCLKSTPYWLTNLTVDNTWCFRRTPSCALLLENPIYLAASIMDFKPEVNPEMNQLSLITDSLMK